MQQYGETEEDGGPGIGESLGKALGRSGIGRIITVVLVFAAVYAYLFLIPKPVEVRIRLESADSDQPVAGAALRAEYEPSIFGSGKSTAIELDDGVYRFKDLPTKTDVMVTITKTGYKTRGIPLSLESTGETKQVDLYKKTDLEIVESGISGAIGATCTKTFAATVNNAGTADIENIELAADGNIPNFRSDLASVIPAQAQRPIAFSITTTYSESGRALPPVSGQLRIKGTDVKVPLNITVFQKSDLSVTPRDLRLKPGAPQVVSIKNLGQPKASNVTIDVDTRLQDVVEFNGINQGASHEIGGGAELKFFVTAKSAGFGIITVNADCASPQQITITAAAS